MELLMAKSHFEHTLKALFIDLFQSVLHHLPFGLLNHLAEWSTFCTRPIDHEKIRLMEQELKKLFNGNVSPANIKSIVQRGVVNVRKDAFETIMMPFLASEDIENMTILSGLENLEEAIAQQKGTFIVLAHFGFRKIILPALGYKGYKINQIAIHPLSLRDTGTQKKPVNKMIEMEYRSEQSFPANFIYLDKFLRPLFKAIDNNEIIAIAIDGPLGLKRIGLRFFNRTAFLSPTPFSLSLKYGSPIVPVFVVRQSNNRHRIIFERPWVVQAGDNDNLAIEQALKQYVDLLQNYVLHYPCHYVDWLYRASFWPIVNDYYVFQ